MSDDTKNKIYMILEALMVIVLLVLFILMWTGVLPPDRESDGQFHTTTEENLIFDMNTNVLYYGDELTPICPYYTKDGNMAWYIDGEIVEMKEYWAED